MTAAPTPFVYPLPSFDLSTRTWILLDKLGEYRTLPMGSWARAAMQRQLARSASRFIGGGL